MESLKEKIHSNLLFASVQVSDSPWLSNVDSIDNEKNVIFLYGSRIFTKLLEHSNSWKSPWLVWHLLGQSGVCVCPKEREAEKGKFLQGRKGWFDADHGAVTGCPWRATCKPRSGMLRKGELGHPSEVLIPPEPQSTPGALEPWEYVRSAA